MRVISEAARRTPLVRSKLSPPPLQVSVIGRPELVARMSGAPRVTVISGPPGCGKTVLARQWLDAAGRPVAWVSVDLLDGSAESLWSHLHAALADIVSGLDRELELLLAERGPDAVFMAALLAELERCDVELGLVLDDISRIDQPRLLDELALFVERAGHLVQLVVTTRSPAALPLARWRARGWSVEIVERDLRFTVADAVALGERLGVALPTGEMSVLVDRLEGWAMGVHVGLLSVDRATAPSEIGSSHESVLASYLVHNVLAQLDPASEQVALAIATPRLFTTSFAEQLLGSEALPRLRELRRGNMFLQQVGDDAKTWRYPRLVRSVLQEELHERDPRQFVELHRRAADIWLAVGDRVEAHHHLTAIDDGEGAFGLVIAPTLDLVDRGDAAGLSRWMLALPQVQEVDEAALALDLVTAAFFARRRDDSWRWWRAAVQLAAAQPPPEIAVRIHASGALLALMDCDVAAAAAHVDRFDRVVAHARVGTDPIVSWFATVRSRVALASGDRAAARNGIDEIRLIGEPENLAMVTAPALEAWLHLLDGDVQTATMLAEAAWQWSTKMDVRMHHGAHEAVVMFARCLLAAGELDRAAELAADATESATVLGFPWDLLRAGVLAADIALAGDGPEAAMRAITELRSELAGAASDYIESEIGRVEAVARARLRGERSTAARVAAVADTAPAAWTLQPLTEREQSLLALLPTHLTYAQIGAELFLSVNTVKSNLKTVYRKLGAGSRAEAVEVARRNGLLGSTG